MKLTSELPQNQSAFACERVEQAVGLLSCCITSVVFRMCCPFVSPPDFHREVVSAGGEDGISDLTPLGARVVVESKTCSVGHCCKVLTQGGQCGEQVETIVFDDAAPLQVRKDLIAMLAFNQGANVTVNDPNAQGGF